MKVHGFKFEIIHGLPINIKVTTDAGKITLHAMCPLGSNKWIGWSQQELAIFDQVGQVLSKS